MDGIMADSYLREEPIGAHGDRSSERRWLTAIDSELKHVLGPDQTAIDGAEPATAHEGCGARGWRRKRWL